MLQGKIKDMRKDAGLSQEELAKKVFYSAHGISQIENGKRGLKVDLFENMLHAMNRDISIYEKGKSLEHSYELLEDSFKKHVKASINELQENINLTIDCVQFIYDAQNNEIDVFFYDESGELIDLEEDIIYKDLKKANYFIYDFLSEKFYPFEDIVIKIGLKNQKINVKKL